MYLKTEIISFNLDSLSQINFLYNPIRKFSICLFQVVIKRKQFTLGIIVLLILLLKRGEEMTKISSETVWSTQILKGLGTDGIKRTCVKIISEKSWGKFRYGCSYRCVFSWRGSVLRDFIPYCISFPIRETLGHPKFLQDRGNIGVFIRVLTFGDSIMNCQ